MWIIIVASLLLVASVLIWRWVQPETLTRERLHDLSVLFLYTLSKGQFGFRKTLHRGGNEVWIRRLNEFHGSGTQQIELSVFPFNQRLLLSLGNIPNSLTNCRVECSNETAIAELSAESDDAMVSLVATFLEACLREIEISIGDSFYFHLYGASVEPGLQRYISFVDRKSRHQG